MGTGLILFQFFLLFNQQLTEWIPGPVVITAELVRRTKNGLIQMQIYKE